MSLFLPVFTGPFRDILSASANLHCPPPDHPQQNDDNKVRI